jgi:glycosyltransferase involved in cell wall biosynthesis
VISIVIPYYNSSKFISRTLESIKGQLFSEWQCILVDDGSSDNSFELVNSLIRNIPKFKNYRRPSGYKPGGNGARNYGFSQVSGDYVVFFDSDDVMYPNYLTSRLRFLELNPDKDGVVTNFGWRVIEKAPNKRVHYYNPEIFDDFQSNTREDWFWLNYMDYRFYFPSSNLLWRYNALKDKALWNEEAYIGQDFEFNARLLLQGLKIGFVRETSWDYMFNPNSKIATSEVIKQLLSRSSVRLLFLRAVDRYLGRRENLFQKELVWQVKILRRVAAREAEESEKQEGINVMMQRIMELMKELKLPMAKRRWMISLLRMLVQFHKKRKKGYSFYTAIFRDEFPTKNGSYFQVIEV